LGHGNEEQRKKGQKTRRRGGVGTEGGNRNSQGKKGRGKSSVRGKYHSEKDCEEKKGPVIGETLGTGGRSVP